ncbi:STAS/SEC14 domain-containing protein [Paracoccus seriniphilus]|uniref:SpoIIAA-like n=2 Tax=Paracoccus seriniphilus TaxID=184748 RepID=A0A239Q230_9RHOB|nr:STAS/SEC14 domain-containing protein [Paracoccus seriniphilus]WCR14530.1 STAS/SEC14 domain-containing protein [Paracoccus seriniphilus]SNT76564.1 SpoIIAA-like [Paracoccus seriniphilus]
MLNIHVDSDRNIITARPEGLIPASEFEALGEAIDSYINERDRMPGLVIHLNALPHWQGLSAMRAHFEVVREHGVVLPRVAIVTDSKGLAFLPNLADIFVRARVRHFDQRNEAEAISWAGAAEHEPEGYLLLDGYPDNVIAIRAVGEVTSRDYEDRLIPLVRKKAKAHGKVRLLMQLGHDFDKYSVGAMWDDARLGLTNWRSFERIAIVSDIGWITRSIKMFAPLMPSEVAVFPDEALDAASDWICEGSAAVVTPPAVKPAPKPATRKPAATRSRRKTTTAKVAAEPQDAAAPKATTAKPATTKAATSKAATTKAANAKPATAARKPATAKAKAGSAAKATAPAPAPKAAAKPEAGVAATRTRRKPASTATSSQAEQAAKPATRSRRKSATTATSKPAETSAPASAPVASKSTAETPAASAPSTPAKPEN